MDLQELQVIAAKCSQCELCEGRIKSVFAKGDINSKIVICGMCPGPDENKVGLPFVGPAGKVLDVLINKTIKCSPYITNLVKCFLSPGINLENEWMIKCLPYFIVQIKEINPRVIVALGGDVSQFLTNTNETMSNLRKKYFEYMGIPLICTYHPSFYCRGGGEKHKKFKDGLDDFNKIFNYI
jgi:DNA polymerase